MNAMIFRVCFLLAFVALRSSIGWGQNCSEILKYGIWERTTIHDKAKDTAAFVNWLCQQNSYDWSKGTDAGLNAKVPVDDLPVEVDGHYRSQDATRYRNAFCSYQSAFSNHEHDLEIALKKASETIVSEWGKCVESNGLHSWIEQTYNPKEFRFVIKYVNKSKPHDTVHVNGVVVKPNTAAHCSASSAPFKNFELGSTPRPFHCTRLTSEALSVELDSQGEPQAIDLPALRPVPQNSDDNCRSRSKNERCLEYFLEGMSFGDGQPDPIPYRIVDRIFTNMPPGAIVEAKYHGPVPQPTSSADLKQTRVQLNMQVSGPPGSGSKIFDGPVGGYVNVIGKGQVAPDGSLRVVFLLQHCQLGAQHVPCSLLSTNPGSLTVTVIKSLAK